MRRRTFISGFISGLAGLAAAATLSTAAFSQSFPNRPVVIVVPFAAGGAFDALARVLAPRMGELLGQQVLVENVTGASGIIGSSRVAHAAPDGLHRAARQHRHARLQPVDLQETRLRSGRRFHAGRPGRRAADGAGRAQGSAGGEPPGIHRLRQSEPRQDAVRFRRDRLDHAFELRAGQCRDRRTAGARALPRRRAGNGRDRGRAH